MAESRGEDARGSGRRSRATALPPAGRASTSSKLDAKGRAYATGKRKDAVARVWIKQGTGKITVNGKEHDAYFARPVLQMILKQPLVAAKRDGQYDVVCTVSGGGLSGQAGASGTASRRRSPATNRSYVVC